MSRCIGCGVKLQSENKDAIGYVPVSSMVEHGDNVYCERCFGIKHHNLDYSKTTYQLFDNPTMIKKLQNEYYQKLATIKGKKVLIVLMIDAMDIYSGFIPDLYKYVEDNPVIILANKVDILPNNIKIGSLAEKIKEIGLNDNLNVRDVYMISALKQKKLENVMTKIKGYLTTKKISLTEVYIVGSTSVGKSTFINSLLKIYANNNEDLLTVSNQHQTTQDFVKIGIGTNAYKDECYLIDTPGAINLYNPTTYLTSESLRLINPKSFIKVRNYQLHDCQTIFYGGLVRVDYEAKAMSVANFVPNELYLHRTKTENAERLLETSMFSLLKPPLTVEEMKRLGEIATYEYLLETTPEIAHWDIAIAGIGYLHLTGEKMKITIHAPKTILISVVPELI